MRVTDKLVGFNLRALSGQGCAHTVVTFFIKEKKMIQRELNRAVAKATGETVAEIKHRGFVLLDDIPSEHEQRAVDWDEQQAERNLCLSPRRKRTPVMV